jgi:thymidylate synthase (FAD)
MKIIEPAVEIIFLEDGHRILQLIEMAGRVCYKSEEKITDSSCEPFISGLIRSGHLSVIEHSYCTVKIICDRGISHEIVRHRLASYSQESTRYANYSDNKFGNEITVIRPCFWEKNDEQYRIWYESMRNAEESYLKLISNGASPQQARSVLPNSLKTEIVMTCNLREWRHVFDLRCSPKAHPQIRQIMFPLLAKLHTRIPVLFDDLYNKYSKDLAKYIADI